MSLRVGIAGYGLAGRYFHAPLLKGSGFEVAAVLTTNSVRAEHARQDFPMTTVVESMEGAALHYIGLQEKIPFLQIRSCSNYIAERNKKNWKMKDAIQQLNVELLKLVAAL